MTRRTQQLEEGEALWYKDAIIYELHVRAFKDSSGDGAGDFRGLTEKLDYLQDLGITAIWLLPFCPSPWRDDGYDISDYTDVHPAYGTLRDFQHFLDAAHARGLRVITELVVNHTSDQHAWFQRARKSPPGSKWRDFYVWSDTPEKYKEARIIFKDFETSNWTWDPVAQAYFWHRFYSHQPDLNYDSPHVRKAVIEAMEFWFDMGVDGLRLDAVPYLYEREGTNCENLPETHQFLKELRAHIDSKYSDKLLLAEANQWPEDSVAYFGDGDECHMAFHFPLMPRMFMAQRMEESFPIIDILDLTPPIPDNAQWALFLRNHDELTLEMVTDEERDYMYRVYATDPQARINLGIRRRLAPLLENSRRRIELMKGLLFSLPGTPVIYYGDEIGMGDNVYQGDRNGVRTPMQWNPDRNAGFSTANPQQLYLPLVIDPEYHYESVNVETQQNNPYSLLWWIKSMIAQRKRWKALSRGAIEFLNPDNRRVLAFVRCYQDERILVVANLSRFPQPVELDLSKFEGQVPVEVFGMVEFPQIRDSGYLITLAPQAFYWFHLEPARPDRESLESVSDPSRLPLMMVKSFRHALDSSGRQVLRRLLPSFLPTRRWFRSKARKIRSLDIVDAIPFDHTGATFVLIRVEYNSGDPELYVVPLSIATGKDRDDILKNNPAIVVARLQDNSGEEGVLYGSFRSKAFCEGLLQALQRKRRFKGEAGDLVTASTRLFRNLMGDDVCLVPSVQRSEQSNTSVVYGDRLILKLFRRIEEGVNPDLEIGRYLTEKTNFRNIAPVAGWIEYQRNGTKMTAAILQAYVPNKGDAWSYSIDALSRYFPRALARGTQGAAPPDLPSNPLDIEEIPESSMKLLESYADDARLLGQRTAEMHLALTQPTADAALSPEPFTDFYQHGLYHGMIALARRSLQLLRQQLRQLPEDVRIPARQVLDLEKQVVQRFRPMRDQRVAALRCRHHGDYHLGQLLYTGRDFVIIDFEGEPLRSISERRIKRSPLRDVAGMLRSFHYVSSAALFGQVPGIVVEERMHDELRRWAHFWYLASSHSFLKGYLETTGSAPFLPKQKDHQHILLDSYTLEKAMYELGYELNNRPDWVRIPLQGILDLLGTGETK